MRRARRAGSHRRDSGDGPERRLPRIVRAGVRRNARLEARSRFRFDPPQHVSEHGRRAPLRPALRRRRHHHSRRARLDREADSRLDAAAARHCRGDRLARARAAPLTLLSSMIPALFLCFFLSGAAALVYEVVWMRVLTLPLLAIAAATVWLGLELRR